MKVYLLFLLFASSYALDFDCLKGPKYWCASYTNAEKCGRVTECFMADGSKKDSVSKMKNDANDVKCELCEKVISELEQQFIPQFTEQQFIDYLVNNVCTKLANEYKALCSAMVRQYGHEIYVQLQSLLKPDFVCKQMGACSASTRISLMTASPETCKICKEVFGFLDGLLNGVTPDELKSILKLVICGQLPAPAKEMCNSLVDGYTDQIYELLKSLMDGNRVCPAIHLCSTEVRPETQSWNCQACLDVVTSLKKDLVNVPASEVEALASNMVCSKLSILVRGICNDEINKYVPVFLNQINSGMTPQQICSQNKLCMLPPTIKVTPAKISLKGFVECDACEVVVNEVKKLLLTPAGEEKVKNFIKTKVCKYFGGEAQQCADFVDKYGDILINFINNQLTGRQICQMLGACSENGQLWKSLSSKKKIGGIECEACTLIFTEVKKFIVDPKHAAMLKSFLRNSVCSLFSSEKTQCQQVVDEYFDIIFNAIVSQLDVTKICQSLHFCSSVKVTKPVLTGAAECEVCEVVMNEVIKLLTTNASQQRITDFLNRNLCPKLHFLSTECTTVVTTYVPYLFTIARESLNSKILCSRLHLCSLVSQQNVKVVLKTMKVKSFQCDLCQFAINETRSLLSNPSIQTTIENFLKEEVCARFGPKQQQCVNDINEYYSFVVNLILEFLTPAICTDIRLCSSKTNQVMMNLLKAKRPEVCETCSLFYQYLQTITINTPNNDIVLGLVGACGRLYHEEKAKCLNHLKNLDVIFESLRNAKSDKQFCEMSKLCQTNTESPMLGQKQCTWGPGFWCISRKHAEFCGIGAVRHCELNVWRANPTL